MNLCDPSNEAVYFWLRDHVEAQKDKVNDLTWRVSTSLLYGDYSDWVRGTYYQKIPVADFWGVIQLQFPFVVIVGSRSDRVFAGMRKKPK